jgi:hypothetical protein
VDGQVERGTYGTVPAERPGRISHFYLFVVTQAPCPGGSVQPAEPGWADGHDLRRDSGDICFRVLTGAKPFPNSWSDTVVIPYPAIRAALGRAGM